MAERTPGEPPCVWTAVAAIADDLAQFARRVEEQLTDMERMQLDNLVLRLDNFVDRLPGAIHAELMHWRKTRQQEKEDPDHA